MKRILLLLIGIAIFNLSNAQTWSKAGNGLPDPVDKLIVYNNKLFAINSHTNIWDGYTWQTFNNSVYILDVVVKEDTLFSLVDNGIYYWKNNSWNIYINYNFISSYGINKIQVYNNEIYIYNVLFYKIKFNSVQIISYPDGVIADMFEYQNNLYLTGCFSGFSGFSSPHIAYYNENGFYPVGIGFPDSTISSMALGYTLAEYNGTLFIGGDISTMNYSAKYLVKWDGTNLSPVQDEPNNLTTLLKTINNKMYMFGGFTSVGTTPINKFGVFDGNNWTNLGDSLDSSDNIISVVEYNGNIYVAGDFALNINSDTIKNIAIISTTTNINKFTNKDAKIAPNPFSEYTTINLPNNKSNIINYTIEVYNILGVLVQTINNIDTKDFKFVNNKLKTGTYIYKITNITGEKYTGKFIIN